VRVGVGPGGGTTDGGVVFGFEEGGEKGKGRRGEESFGHKSDLVMDWRVVSVRGRMGWK
jgi:hypothetical protein